MRILVIYGYLFIFVILFLKSHSRDMSERFKAKVDNSKVQCTDNNDKKTRKNKEIQKNMDFPKSESA